MERPGLADQRKLADWADSVNAPAEFSRLIRRLILETTPGLVQLGMPAGEGVSTGGWDGTIKSTAATAWVPAGLSLWEVSVDKSPGVKANKDYVKRTSTPDGSATTDATYVQALLRKWAKRSDWARDRTADGRWKEVKAYGIDDVDVWVESAPVTWAWISERLGLSPYGMRSIETWWSAWSVQTTTAVTPDLVLAGRSAQADALRTRLAGRPQITTIGGLSLDETCAFIAAVAVKADTQGDSQVLARTAFVNELSAWRSLIDNKGPLILVPVVAGLADEVPSGCAHHVVAPVASGDIADIGLPPLDAHEVAAALTAAGMDEKRAEELGRLARRSLTALRRNLAVKPALHVPAWAGAPVSREVRAALLAGSWSDHGQGDREVLSELAGVDYEPFRDSLGPFASQDDPLMTRVGESWHLVSPFDAWLLLRRHITEDDLRRLEAAVERVLGEEDPALDLPQEDRWKASLEGKVRVFSGDLRRGLAKSLALLAVHGGRIPASAGSNGANWAAYLVRKLLNQANDDVTGRRWASVADLLPLIAEAGPDGFVEAVGAALAGPDPVMARMFTDKEGGGLLSSSSPHTGLLWALETLAWSPDHFGAAIDLLAQLEAVDPGGRLSNRPFHSIATIFCPWHPENSVAPERCLAVVDGLRQRHPDVAWRLLLSMLPTLHGVQSPTSEPAYREWKQPRYPVTNVEYFGFVAETVSRAIEDVGISAERWEALLDRVANLPPDDRIRVIEALGATVESGALQPDQAGQIWQALKGQVGKHKDYSDAPWALPAGEVKRLEDLCLKLTPASSYLASKWLFQDHRPNLGEDVHRGDHEAYQSLLAERRRDAIVAVDAEAGLESVRRLSSESVVPWLVGWALAEAVAGKYEGELLPEIETDGSDFELAANYFGRRFGQEGWPWLDELFGRNSELSAKQQAWLLLGTRDFPQAWEQADARGEDVAREFWSLFVPIGLGQDFGAIELVARRLMGVGRHAAALDFVAMYLRNDQADPADLAQLVATGLEALLQTAADDPELRRLAGYDFETLFALLERHVATVGEAVVGQLEWSWLPALGLDPNVPTLLRVMATNPAFYVEVVSTVYGRRGGEAEELSDEETEQRRARATNGYRLLSSWNSPPGLVDGKLVAEVLTKWIGEATTLLKEADRREVGLVHLGQVLVSAPADDHGLWPPVAVRDLFQSLKNEEIESGFRTEMLNRRGVTSRGLEDGGAQEVGLVAKYRQDAERYADRWPRTAAILRGIAASYDVEARRNEDSAERFRRGLER